MENYSLSDLAAATGNAMGGNEFIWIFALLLLFGGGGFGWNRNNNDAMTQEVLYNQQFQNLGQSINKVGDGIASLGYSQLQQMTADTAAINANVTTEGRALSEKLCAINNNIDNKFAALEKSQLEQRINEQAAQINQLQTQSMLCGIPRVNNTAWGVYPYATGCGCGNV